MTTRALKDFMETRAEVRVRSEWPSPFLLGNVALLSIADSALSLVSRLPKLFPLFCALCTRQKEDAAKKGTSSRKESPSGSP
jgi:hypothetical protein